ncbi:hypothetical protein [Dysgonomonas sp. ZJ709]|uniref:hypothetical protein n=1 Tax=Dysgonomonas sp. ZJ709 TaxID=2709797 RepID=UPI0013EA846A|nr:hypothetical protein [Dysgonomonas sp. ZJ709]
MVYPREIFVFLNSNEDEHRFRLVGQAVASLGYFFSINKYLVDKNKKYIPLIILCFIVIVMLGFRTMLIASIFVTFILVVRIYGFSRKIIVPFLAMILILVVVVQIPFIQDVIARMFERQQTDSFEDSDYIRILQLDYYMNNHFKNIWEFIFGSGIPYPSSDYGYYMYSFHQRDQYGYITGTSITGWFDWGLIGLSWVAGIPTVLAMIAYAIRAYFLKVFSQYYYIGCWFLYLLLVSPLTIEFFREGAFVFHGIALYIVEKAHLEYKRDSILSRKNG